MRRCKDCGATENLQEHHISYEPEETVTLCVNCHKKRHNNNHGVGLGEGRAPSKLTEGVKRKFTRYWKSGKPYEEIMEELGICLATVNNWRKKLSLKKRRRGEGMVDIVVKKLTPEEYGDLITLKKKRGYDSWKELVIAEILEREKND